MHKNWKEKIISYGILVLVSILVSIPLVNKNLDIYRDDGVQHITRLMGTVQTIMEGQFPPMIMSNFANGFGYSWNLFYSPVSAFVPLIFILLGCSYMVSIKWFLFFMIFLSGITMYAFTKKVTKSNGVALIAGILYITMPYHLNDVYNRVAIAEVASFVFLPMVFHGLYKVLHKEKAYVLIVGAAGMILSHTVLTMYTAIMALIYIIASFKEIDKTVIKKLAISAGVVLLLTSFYIEPMLESKLMAEYEVFQPGRMSNLVEIQHEQNSLIDNIAWLDWIYDKNNLMGSYSINFICILGVLSTIFVVKKIKSLPYKTLYFTCLGLGTASLIMTLNIFPFEKLPEILKMLQFKFRMLEFVAIFFSFVAAVNLELLLKNIKIKDVIVIGTMIVVLVIPLKERLVIKEDLILEEAYWPAIPVTENTGRVHAGCASFEYLPSKAFQNMEYVVNRSNEPVVLEGKANISQVEKMGSKMSMLVQNSQGAVIELPYIYYIGYSVILENNGNRQVLKTKESNKGFLQVEVPDTAMEVNLYVKYTGTLGMKTSYLVSFGTLAGMIIHVWMRRKKQHI